VFISILAGLIYATYFNSSNPSNSGTSGTGSKFVYEASELTDLASPVTGVVPP